MAKPKKDSKIEGSKKGTSSYNAKDIMVLEGLEPVRKRPGMYIGSTGVEGLHHLIWEIVDNAIDEAMAGYAKHVSLEIFEDGKVAVTDDGRGIPVETHSQTKKSALETVMTVLHAGGKFGGEGYKVSGGLHGVGASVVNALSSYVEARVWRDGGEFVQEYVRGVPKAKVKRVGSSDKTGTRITFAPDPEIFQTVEWNERTILERLRQEAYLTKSVRITFIDRRAKPPKPHVFYFDGGLLGYCRQHVIGFVALHLKYRYIVRPYQLFYIRHLSGKLVRHGLSVDLIFVVFLVPESRTLHIKGHSQHIGFCIGYEFT